MEVTVPEASADDPPLTYEQWKLREKIKLVEAINYVRPG
jgi:hypothetical protein